MKRDDTMNTSHGSSFMGRDASNTCRDGSLNNTRQSVNTHNSILDLSKDDDDDDDGDDGSVLFESLAAVSLDEDDESTMVEARQFSLHTFLGDTFVDGLCSADIVPDPGCSPRMQPKDEHTRKYYTNEDRLTVGLDIWNLLGCTTNPGDQEIGEIWSRRVDLNRPRRANIKNRMHKIRQLRTVAHGSQPATRHGITFGNSVVPLERARTVDHEDPLARFIGNGLDPIVPTVDGYDSDPEILTTEYTSTPRQAMDGLHDIDDLYNEDMYVRDLVQQTLNSTWTFTWHPNPKNVTEFGLSSSKPICVNLWIERGTVISATGFVCEPTIMWRDAYQPMLADKHRLNKSTQNPWTMRLLNTCRIAECHGNLDRNVYPLARSQNCFYLKTNHGGHEFLFETASMDDVETVCERLKMTVARFASLAVMEDVDSIEAEFFHPTTSSQMLIVDEP